MAITTRTRKLLWAKAAGTCTICKIHLATDSKEFDENTVLGEEAHIVSEQPNGPRYRPMIQKDIDSYKNLLLLCPIHHKIVDEQISYYTEKRLNTLKREHEKWVKDRLSPTESSMKIQDPDPDKPVLLNRVTTGKELMAIIIHSMSVAHENPEPRTKEESNLIGQFFQNAMDNMDVWDEMGLSNQIDAEFSTSKEITQLNDIGLVVYAGAKKHIMLPSTPWPIAYIFIQRFDDKSDIPQALVLMNPGFSLNFG